MTKREDNDATWVEASVEELLGQDTHEEIARREGEWTAFTSAVFARIDDEDLGLARMPLEDQAIDLFRQDVAGELSELAPRFEEGFKEEIEQRIWNAARAPTLADRIRGFFERPFGDGIGFGWAGAMAAAVALVAVTGWPTDPKPQQIAENIPGEVSVKRVSFEGTVTVMPDDGLTVIWLADDASS